MVTLREAYPLENTKPLKKTISSSFFFMLISFLFLLMIILSLIRRDIEFLYLLFEGQIGYVIITFYIGIVFIFVIVKYVYEVFYMKSYFYDLVNDYLIIRKGVFSKK
jgi:uncharacterized membrane protein YdbT with pleckstrin-like domain